MTAPITGGQLNQPYLHPFSSLALSLPYLQLSSPCFSLPSLALPHHSLLIPLIPFSPSPPLLNPFLSLLTHFLF